MTFSPVRIALSWHIRTARLPSRPQVRSIALSRIIINDKSPSNPVFSSKLFGPTKRYRASYSTNKTPQPSPPPKPDVEMPEPTGLIAKSGIELLTCTTPNGYKASILLEELKEAYGKEYTWQGIDISKNTQKEPWFTALNPNGRIPVIVDHDRGGFAVSEGISILGYLARHYDPEHRFSFPAGSDDHTVAENWMAWQHGGLGPMQGQANHFLRFAQERIPYAAQRYVGESERLYGVLDRRLEGRDFVAGPGRGRYSVADVCAVPWANVAAFAGVDLGRFPNVARWAARCLGRPAVRRGFAVPGALPIGNEELRRSLETDPEQRKKAEELAAFLKESQEKYDYKYTSP